MPRFYLIRHAESTCNQWSKENKNASPEEIQRNSEIWDPSLSGKGQQQALELSIALKELCMTENITPRVWVSSLQRARATVNEYTDIYQIIPELQEYTQPHKNPPCPFIVDSDWRSFCRRVVRFVDELRKVPKDQTIFIFGHALFFGVLMTYISNQEQFLYTGPQSIQMDNCSISIVDLRDNHWVIVNTNKKL